MRFDRNTLFMKLFSTLHSLSSPLTSQNLPKDQHRNTTQLEEEIHSLHIMDEMISDMEMDSPSDTSVSIIIEYARQKACLQ